MSSAYIKKLCLKPWKINVRGQKIDGSTLKIFRLVIADFQVDNKVGKPRLFQKNFLVTNIKFEVILGKFFLKISNANISFGEKILTWKFFTIIQSLPTTNQVQLINSTKFVIAALDTDSKTFVVYVAI